MLCAFMWCLYEGPWIWSWELEWGVYSPPSRRTSSVCFHASLTKSFLTLLLFYIPESFLEPAVSRDVDDLCQP